MCIIRDNILSNHQKLETNIILCCFRKIWSYNLTETKSEIEFHRIPWNEINLKRNDSDVKVATIYSSPDIGVEFKVDPIKIISVNKRLQVLNKQHHSLPWWSSYFNVRVVIVPEYRSKCHCTGIRRSSCYTLKTIKIRDTIGAEPQTE